MFLLERAKSVKESEILNNPKKSFQSFSQDHMRVSDSPTKFCREYKTFWTSTFDVLSTNKNLSKISVCICVLI